MYRLPVSVIPILRRSVHFHSTAKMTSSVPKTLSGSLGKRSRLSPVGAHIDIALEDKPPSSSPKRKKRKVKQTIEPYSSDDVLYRDVLHLLKQAGKLINPEDEWDPPLEAGAEIEITVSELSSTGTLTISQSMSYLCVRRFHCHTSFPAAMGSGSPFCTTWRANSRQTISSRATGFICGSPKH